jgi:hypothetical protein
MTQTIQTEITLQPETADLYIKANKEIEQRLGKSPGAEFLMSLVVENEDPKDLADFYCDLVFTEVQP